MNLYTIGLKMPIDDNIRFEISKIGLKIKYEPILNNKLIFVESNLSVKEIEQLEFIETVRASSVGRLC